MFSSKGNLVKFSSSFVNLWAFQVALLTALITWTSSKYDDCLFSDKKYLIWIFNCVLGSQFLNLAPIAIKSKWQQTSLIWFLFNLEGELIWWTNFFQVVDFFLPNFIINYHAKRVGSFLVSLLRKNWLKVVHKAICIGNVEKLVHLFTPTRLFTQFGISKVILNRLSLIEFQKQSKVRFERRRALT